MGRVSVFHLRIEQGNKLPFDNIKPEDRMAWHNSTRTEQGNKLPFDNISPCDRVCVTSKAKPFWMA